jgi:cobyrinic acid a,c-diamide synthase
LAGVTCLGGLPREQSLAIPERHLGLVTSEEHPLTEAYLLQLADVMEAHLDLEALLALMPSVALGEKAVPEPEILPRVRLGVARDQAFCFYYPENFRYLSRFGAELVPFSPLQDARLPENLDGLYLGGGYPEIFARELAANTEMRNTIKEMALAGLPIYGECGGLMYLSQGLTTLTGERVPMTGVLPLEVRMLPRLKALGYRQVSLEAECLLGPAGWQGRGHEFHYSEIISETDGLSKAFRLADRTGKAAAAEGYCLHRTLASYVHLHFGSNPNLARHLVEYCLKYSQDQK